MVTLLGEWTGNVGRGGRGGGQGVVVKVMYESGWVRLAGNKEVPRALGARRCMGSGEVAESTGREVGGGGILYAI